MKPRIYTTVAICSLLVGCIDPNAEKQRKMEEVSRKVLDPLSKDPTAMQIRHLHEGRTGGICGQVNLKDDEGRYRGFAPFYYNVDKRPEPLLFSPAVFSLKGTEDAVSECLSSDEKKSHQASIKRLKNIWEREMEKKYRENHLILLKLKLRCAELGGTNCNVE